jgi:hypothetical protein
MPAIHTNLPGPQWICSAVQCATGLKHKDTWHQASGVNCASKQPNRTLEDTVFVV